jgi:hypothetical protein
VIELPINIHISQHISSPPIIVKIKISAIDSKLSAIQRIQLDQIVDLYTLDYNEIKKQNNQMIDEIQERIALESETGPFNSREYKWDDILVDLEILLPEEEDYLKYLEIKQQNNDFSFYSNTTVAPTSSKSKPNKSKSVSGYLSQQNIDEECREENNEVKNEDENKGLDCDEPSQAVKDEYPSQLYSSEINLSIEEGKNYFEDGKNSIVDEDPNHNDNEENVKNEESNPNPNKQESIEDFENFDANGQNNSNEKLKSRIFMEDMVCQVCNDGDYSEDNLIVFCAVGKIPLFLI